MIETSQFQVLMALNHSDSLSQAAEHLGITQSAVSQHIKNLEVKVGFAIVTRQKKKLVLTPGGQKLAKHGKTHFKRFADLLSEIQQDNDKILGGLALGTLFGIGKSWIAHQMVKFSKEYPDLNIKVGMDYPDRLIAGFEARDYDCLIVPKDMVPTHCEFKILHDEVATLVIPKSPEYADITTNITLKELTEYPIIYFEERDPLFLNWCKMTFGSTPRNIKPRLVVNAFGQMLQACHEGLGIAVVPTHVLERSFFKERIKTLGEKFEQTNSEFNFVYHTESKNSLKLKVLFEFLENEVKSFQS